MQNFNAFVSAAVIYYGYIKTICFGLIERGDNVRYKMCCGYKIYIVSAILLKLQKYFRKTGSAYVFSACIVRYSRVLTKYAG